jgi:hypothetical protein
VIAEASGKESGIVSAMLLPTHLRLIRKQRHERICRNNE